MEMTAMELAQDLVNLELGARELESEAAQLEGWAADRYADSPYRYRYGTATIVKSWHKAEEYEEEAAALRAKARGYRASAAEAKRNFPAAARLAAQMGG